ncbi:MAG: glycosyltransferase family 39 protein [Candidatus Bathyarchaeia archaeon]
MCLIKLNQVIFKTCKHSVSLSFLSILAAGMFFRIYNLLFFHPMTADECVYTQAVFAITKGYMPYRDIFVAHPLVYFYIEYPFMCLFPSLLSARLVSVLLSLGVMLLTFYIAKSLYSREVALLAMALFAFSPYTIYYNKLAIVENAVLFFVTLSLYFFFKYYKFGRGRDLFFCGFLSGIAFISKYSALVVIIVIVFFVALKDFKRLGNFIGATSLMPSLFLLLLVLSNVHNYWFAQTVVFQIIRFGFPLHMKLFELGFFLALSSPLFVAATPIITFKKSKEDFMMILLYIIPFMLILLGKVIINHYFLMLLPILCIIGARSLHQYICYKKGKKMYITTAAIVSIFVVHFFITSSLFVGSPSSELAVRAKMEVADYIRNITADNDKIWTTEADIAFFATRLIISPNSTIWKYQGFYEDVWGFFGTSYIGGFAGYSNGLITLNEIRQALDVERPKVIVIMRNKIADNLIWNGINTPNYHEDGLAEYILTNYRLSFTHHNIDVYVIK